MVEVNKCLLSRSATSHCTFSLGSNFIMPLRKCYGYLCSGVVLFPLWDYRPKNIWEQESHFIRVFLIFYVTRIPHKRISISWKPVHLRSNNITWIRVRISPFPFSDKREEIGVERGEGKGGERRNEGERGKQADQMNYQM